MKRRKILILVVAALLIAILASCSSGGKITVSEVDNSDQNYDLLITTSGDAVVMPEEFAELKAQGAQILYEGVDGTRYNSQEVPTAAGSYSVTVRYAGANGEETRIFSLLVAAPEDEQNYTTTTVDGEVYLVGYNNLTAASVDLTDVTVNGLPISYIGTNAFRNRTAIRTLTLPNTVKSIGAVSFFGCSGLTTVNVPVSLIPKSANYAWNFYGASAVSTVRITEGAELPDETFRYSSLSTININTITSIGNYAFADMPNLTTLTLSPDLSVIGVGAFLNNVKLSSISLGAKAGDTLSGGFLSEDAFNGMTNLSYFDVSPENPVYSDVDGVLAKGGTLVSYPAKYAGSKTVAAPLTAYTTPSSITAIGANAFYYAGALTSVTLGANVISVSAGAMRGLVNATAFASSSPSFSTADGVLFNTNKTTLIAYPAKKAGTTYSSTATTISAYAFYCAAYLTAVDLGITVNTVGANAFKNTVIDTVTAPARTFSTVLDNEQWNYYGATGIKYVTLSSGTVASKAFFNSPILSVTFGGSIDSIGISAFENCTSLTSMFFAPTSGARLVIRARAFANCSALHSVSIPDYINTIGDNAFLNMTLENLTTPSSVLYDQSKKTVWNFYGASNVGTVRISSGNSVTPYAFYQSPITSVYLPASVAVIGASAFSGSTSLASVNFPEDGSSTLTAINASAFARNSALTSINLPASLTSIGESAFEGATSLLSVNFMGSLINNIGASAFKYAKKLTSFTVPRLVTSINEATFYGCNALYNFSFSAGALANSIGASAFYDCYSLPSITLPAGLTKISNSTFYNAKALTSVTFPSTLTEIGAYAFYGALKLSSLNISSNVNSIGNYAFYGCNNITRITIPASVLYNNSTSLNWNFYGCETISEVTVNGGFIPDGAFYGFSELASLTLGEGVTGIGSYAFRECNAISSIVIPSTVTEIKDFAFYDCSALVSLTFNTSAGVSALRRIGDKAFYNNVNIGSALVLPAGLLTVGKNAFSYDKDAFVFDSLKLTSVSVPSSVTVIDDYAFAGQKKINTVTLQNSGALVKIGNSAFYDCQNLANFNLPSALTSIGTYAFYNCFALSALSIPAGVKEISRYAFGNCNNLGTVSFAEASALYQISEYAFSNCTALASSDVSGYFALPGGLCVIEPFAFLNCNAVTKLSLPAQLLWNNSEEKDSSMLWDFFGCNNIGMVKVNTGYASVTDLFGVNKGVLNYNRIIEYAFYKGQNITDIEVDASIVEIGNEAFSYTTYITTQLPTSGIYVENGTLVSYVDDLGVTNLVIPATVTDGEHSVAITSISAGAFKGNATLTSISFAPGSSITHISEEAFANMPALQEVTLPASVTSIGQKAFYGCTELAGVNLSPNITLIETLAFGGCDKLINLVTPGAVLWNNQGNASWSFYGANNISILTVINGAIPIYAFSNNLKLVTINIEAISALGAYAFTGCANLASVSFSDNEILEVIGAHAFDGAGMVKVISLPNCVKEIGDYAFANMTNLEAFTMSGNLTKIGEGAFYQDESLASIAIPTYVESIGANAFAYCVGLQNIGFAAGCKLALLGSGAFINCVALTAVELPSTLASVGESAFESCGMIEEITFAYGSRLSVINNYAFRHCVSLKNITLPSTLKIIGMEAFYNCASLASVTTEDNSVLTTIGNRAFFNSLGLVSITITSLQDIALGTDAFGTVTAIYLHSTMIVKYLKKTGTWKTYASKLLPYDLTEVNYKYEDYGVGGVRLTKYLGEDFHIVVPSNIAGKPVLSISSDTFRGYGKISSIYIPESVVQIDNETLSTLTRRLEAPSEDKIDASSGDITIIYTPAELLMPPQTNASFSFYGATNVLKLIIVSGTLAQGIFEGYGLLNSVTFGKNATGISIGAFKNCAGLANVEFEEGNAISEIPSEAFANCSSLTSLTLLPSVTSIASDAFIGCNGLNSVTIHSNVLWDNTVPVQWNFYGTLTVSEVTVTGGNIPANAFLHSPNVTKITIINYETFGIGAFSGSNIENIVIPSTMSAIPAYAFNGCTMLKSVNLASSVITSIGNFAFEGCNNVAFTTIVLPGTLQSIGESAFMNCTSLLNVTVSTGVTSIGANAFVNTAWYSSMESEGLVIIGGVLIKCNSVGVVSDIMLAGVTSIASGAFNGNTVTTEVILPTTVRYIDNNAFSGSSVSRLVIPVGTSIVELPDNALAGLTLNTLEIPSSLLINKGVASLSIYGTGNVSSVRIFIDTVNIAPNALKDGTAVTSVEFVLGSVELKSIGMGAFSGTSITELIVPASVIYIGNDAFNTATLATLTMSAALLKERPDLVGSANSATIYGANNISTLTLSGGTFIPECALYRYSSLVTLNKNADVTITNIADYALYNCTALANVNIFTSELLYLGQDAVYSNLWVDNAVAETAAEIGGGTATTYATVRYGILLHFASGGPTDAFPAGIRIINSDALSVESKYAGVRLFTAVTIPASVIHIGSYAFLGQNTATTLTFEAGSALKFIGVGAFSGMTAVSSITVPTGPEKIYVNTFANCYNLANVILPNTVTYVTSNAFGIDEGRNEIVTMQTANYATAAEALAAANAMQPESTLTPYSGLEFYVYADMTEQMSGAEYYYTFTRTTYKAETYAAISRAALSEVRLAVTISGCALQDQTETQQWKFFGNPYCDEINVIAGTDVNKEITTGAFYNATLKALTVADDVLKINANVFNGLNGITALILNGVMSIGEGAFANTAFNHTNLTIGGVSAPTPTMYWEDGILIDKTQNTSHIILLYPTTLTASAFNMATTLEFVDFIGKIGKDAFKGVTALTDLTVTARVIYSADASLKFADFGASSVTSLSVIGNTFMAVDYFTVPDNFALESTVQNVTISGITSIGKYSFARNTALLTFTADSALVRIGENAFNGCSSLTRANLNIPATTTDFGTNAFKYTALDETASGTSIIVNGILITYAGSADTIDLRGQGITGITENAFNGIGATTLYASADLFRPWDGSVGWNFYGAGSITSVILTDGILCESAFYNASNIVSVTLNVGVTAIGANAFKGTSALTTIVIPYTVTSIGENAFLNSSIQNATIDVNIISGVQAEIYSFYGATTITSFNIGTASGVSAIPDYAFYNAVNLSTVSLTDITSIGKYAFYNTGIINIVFPSSVSAIGEGAYMNSMAETLVIPVSCAISSATNIGDGAFSSKKLNSVVSNSANFTAIENVLYFGNILIVYPAMLTASSLTLNDTVTAVKRNAFYNNAFITSVTAPLALFVTIPNTERFTFYGCDTVTSVVASGDGVLSSYAFYKADKLLSVTFSGNVTTIGERAFFEAGIENIILPDSVTTIGDYAFSGAARLANVGNALGYMPAGLVTLSQRAFENCVSLTSIDFSYASSFNTIGEGAFNGAQLLKNVKLGTHLIELGASAFGNCSSLIEITIPETLTRLNIGENTFGGCQSLQKIYASATMFTDASGQSAWNFFGAVGIKEIIVTSGSTIEANAFLAAASLVSIVLPTSVISIGLNAFKNCTGLTDLAARAELFATNTGDAWRFYGASSIVTININGGTVVAAAAFKYSNAKSIVIAASVTSIGNEAFAYMPKLKSIKFAEGSQLNSIGSNILTYEITPLGQHKTSFESITFTSNAVPQINADTFSENGTYSIYVPEAAIAAYIAAWPEIQSRLVKDVTFTQNNIIYIPYTETIEGVLHYFVRVVGITGGNVADIPDTITEGGIVYTVNTIYLEAFKGSSLEVISLPVSLKRINPYAFSECDKLIRIIFNGSVPTVDANAFVFDDYNKLRVFVPENELSNYKNSSSFSAMRNSIFSKIGLSSNNATWATTVSGSGVRIVQYYGSASSLYIPDTLNGSTVNSIGSYAFHSATSLVSVIIPISVTSVAASAFYKADNLMSLTAPVVVMPSVAYAEGWSFYGAKNIQTISLTGNGKLPNNAFYYNPALSTQSPLTSVTIGAGINEIGTRAFYNCKNITVLNFIADSTLVTIGAEAFSGCTGLTGGSILASLGNLQSVNANAFYGCTGLSGTMVLPLKVTSVGGGAFAKTSITSFTSSAPNMVVNEDALYSRNHITGKLTLLAYPAGKIATTVNLLPETENIISGVFAGNGYITQIDLSSLTALVRLESNVFENCTALTTVVLPVGLTSIGSNAFYGCGNLTAISLSGINLTAIEAGAFENCTSLYSLSIPASVVTIGDRVFAGCSALKVVTFSGTGVLETIGNSAFLNCSSIESLVFPNKVNSIGYAAFNGCTALQTVTITSEKLPALGLNAFNNINNLAFRVYVPSILLPYINNNAVWKASIDYIALGSDQFILETIDGGVLIRKYVGSHSTVIIPETVNGNTVLIIAEEAFMNSNIVSVTIPATVNLIGDRAFRGCEYLNVVILKQTTGTPITVGGSGIFELTSITLKIYVFDDLLTQYKSAWSSLVVSVEDTFTVTSNIVGNFAYELIGAVGSETLRITQYLSSDSTVNIPSIVNFKDKSYRVSELGNFAFYRILQLGAVTFPSTSFLIIGNNAFYGCSNLYVAFLPESVTSIGANAFSGCVKLTSVTIPSDLVSLGTSAYENCVKLTTVVFNDKLTSISQNAFSGCISLKTVNFNATSLMNSIGQNAFYGCYSLRHLILPKHVSIIGRDAFSATFDPATGLGLLSIRFNFGIDGGTGSEKVVLNENGSFNACSPALKLYFIDAVSALYAGDPLQNIIYSQNIIDLDGFAIADSLGVKTVIQYLGTAIDVVVPYNDIIAIGEYAFFANETINSISLPASVRFIRASAFGYSGLLSFSTANTSIESIEAYAFRNSKLISFNDPTEIKEGETVVWTSSLTTIADHAFYNANKLYTVVLNDALTGIGANAFENATVLNTLKIPNSVVTLGENALLNANKLRTVYVSSALVPERTVAERAFVWDLRGALNITTLYLYNGTVNNYAFYNAVDLVNVYIDGVTSIGEYAFAVNSFVGASKLANLVLSGAVPTLTNIGAFAFMSCTSLEVLNIPYSVATIGERAFYGLSVLTSVNINNSVNVAENAALTIGSEAFSQNKRLETVALGNYVATILNSAFRDCTSLISVSNDGTLLGTMPDTLTSIGNYAFNNCASLEKITFNPTGALTSVGDYSFANTKALTDVIFPENTGNISVGVYAFANNIYETSALVNVDLGGTTTIGIYAFRNNDNLLNVDFGTKLISIAAFAFENCKNLTQAVLPASIISIGNDAFRLNIALSALVLGVTKEQEAGGTHAVLTDIGARAFYDCDSLTSVYVPDSVNNLGAAAFENSSGIVSVSLGSGLTQLNDNMFSGASSLAIVSFRSGSQIASIGNKAFYQCSMLSAITLPMSVRSLGTEAFSETGIMVMRIMYEGEITFNTGSVVVAPAGTMRIYVPASVMSAYQTTYYGWNALDEAGATYVSDSSLVGDYQITLNGSDVTIDYYVGSEPVVVIPSLLGGNPVKTIGSTAFTGRKDISSVTIPDSVTNIMENAFSGCINIDELTIIGASGLTIQNYAFYGLIKLASLIIPATVSSIGQSAFEQATALTSLSFVNGSLTSIGANAFAGCKLIESLILPESLVTLNENAFFGCSGMTNISIGSNIATIGLNAFGDTSAVRTLSAPAHIIASPASGTWSGFFGTSRLENITVTVGSSGFSGYNSLKSNAFNGLSYLKTAVLNNGILSVGEQAFKNTILLENISLPASLSSIGLNAFAGTAKLNNVTVPTSALVNMSAEPVWHFFGNTVLTSITVVPGAVSADIPEYAFYRLSGIIISLNGINTIGNHAFSESDIVSINIDAATIGDFAFSNIDTLISVNISNRVTSIGASAFENCYYLNSLIFDARTLQYSIGSKAFNNCNELKTVDFGAYLNSIAIDSLIGCNKLIYVTIPNFVLVDNSSLGAGEVWSLAGSSSIIKIKVILGAAGDSSTLKAGAFAYATGLKVVELSSDFTSLGSMAFYGCKNLFALIANSAAPISAGSNVFGDDPVSKLNTVKSAMLNEGKKFGENYIDEELEAFANAYDYTQCILYIPDTALFSGYGIGFTSTFDPLKNVYSTANISSDGSYSLSLIDANNAKLLQFIGVDTEKTVTAFNVNIPVKEIAPFAFYNNSVLKKLVLPNTVSKIDMFAFSGVKALTQLYYGTGLISIGDYAFSNATGMTYAAATVPTGDPTNFTIAETVTSIGKFMMLNATNVGILNLSRNVAVIPKGAFMGMSKLVTATLSGTALNTISDYAFYGDVKLSRFNATTNLKTIGKYAFYNALLTSLSVGNVEIIDDYAFYGTSVGAFSFNAGIKTIGNYAFANIVTLGNISFNYATNLSSIGNYAFYYKVYEENRFKPSRIDLRYAPLVSIGNGAFQNGGFTRVYLPASLTTIGANAFRGNHNLLSVYIGTPGTTDSQIQSIGAGAFQDCKYTYGYVDAASSAAPSGSVLVKFYNLDNTKEYALFDATDSFVYGIDNWVSPTLVSGLNNSYELCFNTALTAGSVYTLKMRTPAVGAEPAGAPVIFANQTAKLSIIMSSDYYLEYSLNDGINPAGAFVASQTIRDVIDTSTPGYVEGAEVPSVKYEAIIEVQDGVSYTLNTRTGYDRLLLFIYTVNTSLVIENNAVILEPYDNVSVYIGQAITDAHATDTSGFFFDLNGHFIDITDPEAQNYPSI